MKNFALVVLFSLMYGCESKERRKAENDYRSTKDLPISDPFLSKYFFDDSRDVLQLKVESFTNYQIDSLLRSLLKSDQKYREQINEVRLNDNENQMALRDLSSKMKRTDTINFIVLNRIINRIGWPSKNVFSDSAVDASFFVTLHHSGNEMSYLTPIIEESFCRGEIRNDHYAILTDRVLIRSGVYQKYGTHCRKNSAGSVDFVSLPDSSFVNERRTQIGLTTLNWKICDLVIY